MFNRWLCLTCLSMLSIAQLGWAAPQPPPTFRPSPPPSTQYDPAMLIKQFRTSLSEIKHEVSNHEVEIQQLVGKLNSQEHDLYDLKEEISKDQEVQKNVIKAFTNDTAAKFKAAEQALTHLENSLNTIIDDLKQLRNQGNESVQAIGQQKEKISALEKLVESQNQHLEKLESALQVIIELIDSTNKLSNGSKTYKVQAGDSLGKIAQEQKVSLKSLREANQLVNDKIVPGQTLKIP